MSHFMRFKLENHETFHAEIIEHQVNIKVIQVCCDMLLTLHESKTSPKLQNEFFKVVNKGLFQLRLAVF